MPVNRNEYTRVERVVFRRTRNFEAFSGPTRRAVERYVLRETGRAAEALERIGYKWDTETVLVPPGKMKESRGCSTLVGRYYWDGVEYDFDALEKAVNRDVGNFVAGRKLNGPPQRMQLVDKRRRKNNPEYRENSRCASCQ